jgi:hypothetical protein
MIYKEVAPLALPKIEMRSGQKNIEYHMLQ